MAKQHREAVYHYEVIFDPNGAGYTVTVPKLPGLVTEGDSLKEARLMAKDAIRCYLEALLKERINRKRASNHSFPSRRSGAKNYQVNYGTSRAYR